MKGYTQQKLEECGFLSKMFGSKPAENAWKELNNLLADAPNAQAVTKEAVTKALKTWGVKFSEENMQKRSALYRKLADVVYTDAQTADDALFADIEHLAEVLELPAHLAKLADKGAKTTAYFARCNKLLKGEEKLDINAINAIFGYDYEDGLAIRKQVFQAHFNNILDEISQKQRFSPEEEAELRADCATLDIPYEFKSNVVASLEKYRSLWNAENSEPQPIEVELPLNDGEKCYATVNCGLCQNKVIEREDNYYELTRKFRLDETVNFKGEKMEMPKIQEEITALLELGHFVLTSERIIYLSKDNAFGIKIDDIISSEFDNINIVTFHRPEGKDDIMLKFPDEAAGVMHILFNKLKAKRK